MNPVAFKIMNCLSRKAIPWELIAPHEAQALKNHYQTLVRLNERGGLSVYETLAVLEDRGWASTPPTANVELEARLEELVMKWSEK